MELNDAFVRLQSDRKLAERFVEDPEGVLSIMGIDTSDLVIQRTVGGTQPFNSVRELRRLGPNAGPLGLTICASIGYIVCASVGGSTAKAGPLMAKPRKARK